MGYYLPDEATNFLATAGLVELPGGAGTLPKCFSNPKEGLGEPSGSLPVCALFQSDHIPQMAYENGWRYPILSFLVRGTEQDSVLQLHEDVRLLWDDVKEFDLNDLRILWARVWRPAYHVTLTSKKSYFSYAADFSFMVRTRALNDL